MQKKTLFTLLAMLTMLAISMPALSIELPTDATPVFEIRQQRIRHHLNTTNCSRRMA